MAGNEVAGVLDPEMPLDQALQQIPSLRDDPQGGRDGGDAPGPKLEDQTSDQI